MKQLAFTILFCLPLFLASAQKTPTDSTLKKVVKGFVIDGNKQTHNRIIQREVPFKVGDTLRVFELEYQCVLARKNIFNTHLFNFVEVTPVYTDNENVFVKISVTERWYWWPAPVFENADPNFNIWWERRDFSRANYGLILYKQNFRGRNEDLYLKAKLGYTNEFKVTYRIPFINKSQNLGLTLSGLYKEQDEITYATFNNERVFYRHPETSSREEQIYSIEMPYRRGIYSTHAPKITYVKSAIRDSLSNVAPDYFGSSRKHINYFKLSYFFTHDKRDIRAYPLKGSYLRVGVEKRGLGLLKENSVDLLGAVGRFKKYWQLHKRWYFAAGVAGRTNLTNQIPYYLQEGLGYSDFVRGYEYYIVDGQHYALGRSNLKFAVIPNRVLDLGFGPEKFTKIYYALYLNGFFDAGHVWDSRYSENNPLANEVMMSGGLGLDFVTYYDSVFRMEVAYNRFKEIGFFLHFVQPI
ncbi:BamA/TamA family outer membrane protein [Halocola ammonii]